MKQELGAIESKIADVGAPKALSKEVLNDNFFGAIQREDAIAMRYWMKLGADIHATWGGREHGKRALHQAARNESPECLQALLPLMDPRARDRHGFDCLMHAAMADSYACARLLYPLCDPSARSHKGHTALGYALEHSNLGMFELLLPGSSVEGFEAHDRMVSILPTIGDGTFLARLAQERERRSAMGLREELQGALPVAQRSKRPSL